MERRPVMIARKHGTALVLIFLLGACSKSLAPSKPEPTQPSTIKVEVKGGGPVVLVTSAAEFEVGADGYVRASLLKDGKKLSLDEPNVGAPADSDFVRVRGKEVHFTLDFQQTQVHEAI